MGKVAKLKTSVEPCTLGANRRTGQASRMSCLDVLSSTVSLWRGVLSDPEMLSHVHRGHNMVTTTSLRPRARKRGRDASRKHGVLVAEAS